MAKQKASCTHHITCIYDTATSVLTQTWYRIRFVILKYTNHNIPTLQTGCNQSRIDSSCPTGLMWVARVGLLFTPRQQKWFGNRFFLPFSVRCYGDSNVPVVNNARVQRRRHKFVATLAHDIFAIISRYKLSV